MLNRQKPQKSSTIFVLALAVAVIMHLLSAKQILATFYTDSGHVSGFPYSRSVALCLFILSCLENTLKYSGTSTSLSLPICITLERFLAVYFPFQFRRILTSRRAKWFVVIIFIVWIPQVAISAWLVRFVSTEQGIGVIQEVKGSHTVEELYNFT